MPLSDALSLHLSRDFDSIQCPYTGPNFDTQCNKLTYPSKLLLKQMERAKLGDPSAPALLRKMAGEMLCENHNNQEERERIIALWMGRLNSALILSLSKIRQSTSTKTPPVAATVTEEQTAVKKGPQELEDQLKKEKEQEKSEDKNRRQDRTEMVKTPEPPGTFERQSAVTQQLHEPYVTTQGQETWDSDARWDRIILYLLLAYTIITLSLRA